MLNHSCTASVIQAAADDAYGLPNMGADVGESVLTRTNDVCYRCTLTLVSALGFQRNVCFIMGPHKSESETSLWNKKFFSKVIEGHRNKAARTRCDNRSNPVKYCILGLLVKTEGAIGNPLGQPRSAQCTF